MFNLISTKLVRPVILASIVFAGANAVLAQVPQSTPRPTPAPGDPTRPPGQDPIPGTTTPTQNPTAPPGTQQTSPSAPPGTVVPQTPGVRPSPTPPAGNVPGGSNVTAFALRRLNCARSRVSSIRSSRSRRNTTSAFLHSRARWAAVP